jgi:Flp pilus assembly protein TadG
VSRLRRTRERGQSMVEFAVVSQIFFLLLFAIWDVGGAYFDKLSLEQATRDAARKAVVNRSLPTASIVAAAQAEAKKTGSRLDSSKLTVNVTSTDNPQAVNGIYWEQGDVVTVVATYPWRISVVGITFGSGTLSSRTSLRME